MTKQNVTILRRGHYFVNCASFPETVAWRSIKDLQDDGTSSGN